MKTVNDLSPGDRGVIETIMAPPGIRRRIMDMGIIKGIEVEMVKSAPLGDPIEIKVHNTSIALRRNEACKLIIERHGKTHRERKRHRHRSGR